MKRLLPSLAIALLFLPFFAFSTTYYAKPSATGTGTGLSWTNASSLANALNSATSGDEIWVMQGTHYPTMDTLFSTSPSDSRQVTFCIKSGVKINGGFVGNETLLAQRNAQNYPTILSGDIGTIGTTSDNAYHVIAFKVNTATTTLVDGFTIQDGNADIGGSFRNTGGGIFIRSLSGNECKPTFNQCVVKNNLGGNGSGLYISNASPTFTRMVFFNNTATANGGAINLTASSTIFTTAPTFTNCVIASNNASSGAGVYISAASSAINTPTFDYCTVYGNAANPNSGGGIYQSNTSSTLTTTFTNSILWGNTSVANSSQAQLYNVGGVGTMSNTLVESGLPTGITDGGGNASTNANFTNTSDLDGTDNKWMTTDDGLKPACVSNAINLANPSSLITMDITGTSRPQGGGNNDAGAYETANMPLRLYVKANAAGNNNGTSWADAFTDLQSALNYTCLATGAEIWVAAGTYKPTSGTDRTLKFTIPSNAKIYGGFAGTETLLSQRPTNVIGGGANATIISGDIGTVDNNNDNTYTLLWFINTAKTTFDGFTIEKAGGGTAIYVSNSSASADSVYIQNILIQNNTATNDGAGIYLESGNTGARSYFYNNIVFANNYAGRWGGAIYNVGNNASGSNDLTSYFTNCVFTGNTAFAASSNPASAINNNGYGSGSVSNLSITNCTFYGNTGYGISGFYSAPSVVATKNNIFYGNTGGIYDNGGSNITVTYSNVQGGYAGTGNINSNAYFTNTGDLDGADNIWGTSDDGLLLAGCSSSFNTGNNTNAPATDIIGTSRPQQSTVDMGAYEATASAASLVTRLYVKANATGANNGSSWTDAYTSLQSALGYACLAAGAEIWVANGIYTPSADARGNTSPADARDKTFYLLDGIKLYGGFVGTETSTTQRSFDTQGGSATCILTGDIGIANNNSDNCYHVISYNTSSQSATSVTIDGFTITGGNANGSGNFALANGNGLSRSEGGAMYLYSGTKNLKHLTLTNNTGSNNGAVLYTYNYNGDTTATFRALLDSSIVSNNSSSASQVYFNYGRNTIRNNKFSGNTVSVSGSGVIYFYSSRDVVESNQFLNNTAATGSTAFSYAGDSLFLSKNFFANNSSSNSAGIVELNIYSKRYLGILNNLFYSNTGTQGSGLRISVGNTPTAIINNSFISNGFTATNGYGALYVQDGSNLQVNNNIFYNNTANGSTTVAGVDYSNYSSGGAVFKNNLMQLASSNYTNTASGTYHLGTTASGNLFAQNPLLVNISDADGADNIFGTSDDGLQVRMSSPCVNAGNNTNVSSTDIVGKTRVQSSVADMGAYEREAFFTWNGSFNRAWNATDNWNQSSIPSLNDDVLIPAAAPRMPITVNLSGCKQLEIQDGATVDVENNFTIQQLVYANHGINTFIANTELVLGGSTAQTISGSAFTNNIVSNLTINNPAGITIKSTTSDTLKVTGILTPTTGVLTTNGNLLLKSTSITNTAQIGITGGSIAGNVTVERFIPARRSFRFLSPGVNTVASIKSNWQEGANNTTTNSNINPNAGYGTHITGSTSGANGFDATLTGNPSLFTFNNATQAWSAIANTNSSVLNTGTGYRLMVRGDRSIDLNTNTPTPTNTILRTTGTVTTGTVNFTGLATGINQFSFLGNPYCAAVDWTTVTKTNIGETYWIWDPTIAGSNNRGGYVSFTKTGAGTGISSGGGSINKNIQPGQAFFVQNTAASPSLSFAESNKSVGNALTNTFRTSNDAGNVQGLLTIKLYVASNYQQGLMADAGTIAFSNMFSNGKDTYDAAKFTNLDEGISITNKQGSFALDARQLPTANDTIQLQLSNLLSNDYMLQIDGSYFANTPLQAWLYDRIFSTKMLLNKNGSTTIPFTKDSSSANRFSIVFNNELIIANSATSLQMQLSPNVASSQTALQYEASQKGQASIRLISSNGQCMQSINLGLQQQGNYTLALGKLAAGMYWVELTIGNERKTMKFIKQ